MRVERIHYVYVIPSYLKHIGAVLPRRWALRENSVSFGAMAGR